MMVVQSDPQKRAMYVLESKRMKWAHTHTRTRTKTDTNASESATNAEIQEFGNCFSICCCDQKPLECDYGWKDDKHHFRIFFHFLHINYGSKFIKCDIHQWLSLYFQFFFSLSLLCHLFPFHFLSSVGFVLRVSRAHIRKTWRCVSLCCVWIGIWAGNFQNRKWLYPTQIILPMPTLFPSAFFSPTPKNRMEKKRYLKMSCKLSENCQ